MPLSNASTGSTPAADRTVPQHWANYSAAEHAVWQTLFQRQMQLLPGLACDAFVQGMRRLPLQAERIPDFEQLSQVLQQETGWRVVAVPGLVSDEVFFEHLAHRRFPAGRFIRSASELDYLQEPDIFHDVFGHVPMLMNPVMADFMALYGQAGLRAQRLGKLKELARVYWYTVEFGLVRQGSDVRLYGAGIASSSSESSFAVHSDSPNRIGFDLERVMRTNYRIDNFQESYFVLEQLEDLLALANIDFAPYYARLDQGPSYQPGDCLPDDHLIRRGTGSYHADRR